MKLEAKRPFLQLDTLKKIVFIFPVIFIFCFIFLKIGFNNVYASMIQEDNFVENAEAIVYIISFLFALSISIDFFKIRHTLYGLFYLVICILVIFVCGEEISWGQRLFNMDIPEFFKINNIQEEINLHNLSILHYLFYGTYVLIGFFGAFARLLLPKRIKNRHSAFASFFIPDWYLIFYFLPVFIIFSLYCLYGALILCFGICPFSLENGSFFVWRDQEPAEFLLALGFLFFVIINKYRQNVATVR